MVNCAAPSLICNGQCTDVLTDPRNCGRCGKPVRASPSAHILLPWSSILTSSPSSSARPAFVKTEPVRIRPAPAKLARHSPPAARAVPVSAPVQRRAQGSAWMGPPLVTAWLTAIPTPTARQARPARLTHAATATFVLARQLAADTVYDDGTCSMALMASWRRGAAPAQMTR